MMHPFAGHAAMAAETPPEKRSANRIFDRFCMLTIPLESVIWEFTRDVVEENFGIVFSVPEPVVTVDASTELATALAFCAATGPGPADGDSAAGRFWATELAPALANADAGNPPNVLASSAFNA